MFDLMLNRYVILDSNFDFVYSTKYYENRLKRKLIPVLCIKFCMSIFNLIVKVDNI